MKYRHRGRFAGLARKLRAYERTKRAEKKRAAGARAGRVLQEALDTTYAECRRLNLPATSQLLRAGLRMRDKRTIREHLESVRRLAPRLRPIRSTEEFVEALKGRAPNVLFCTFPPG